MRKFLIAIATLLGVLFLITRFTELQDIASVLQRAHLAYILLALLAQAAWIYNLGIFYQAIYHLLGMVEERLPLIRLATAANFLSVIAPSGGLSGMAVFIGDARRNGRSTAKVTVAGALYVWFEYIGVLAVLVLGLAELARRDSLAWPEIVASLVLLAGALGFALLLYLGMESTLALGRALAWMAGAVNAVVRVFLQRDYLEVARAHIFAEELSDGLSAMRGHPRWIYKPLILALVNKALLLSVLALCFRAFDVPFTFGTLVAGLSIAHLFVIVSPTPSGIGIVEGVMALALGALGVQPQDAAVITLAYRGLSFWLPFFAGMAAFRRISRAEKSAPSRSVAAR